MAQQRRRRSGGLLGALSKRFTDPQQVGGSINPTTRLIDPTDAMILENVAIAEMGMEHEDGKGEVVLALELKGKINTTGNPANPLVLMSPDGAALLVSQIIGLVRDSRIGPEFDHLLAGRMKEALGAENRG